MAESRPRAGIYRGWAVAGVTFVTLGAAIGTAQFAFGVFIIPLEQEFGWTRTQINISLSLGILGSLTAPFVGRLLDRVGARWTMGVSMAIIAAAFLLRSAMTELWHFYLLSTLIFVAVGGATNLTAGRLVGLWFPRTSGRMMGIVTAGNNFGGMVSISAVAALIVAVGWRSTFALIGMVMVGITALIFVVVRDRAEDVAQEVGKRWAPVQRAGSAEHTAGRGLTTAEAMRQRAFWLLLIGMATQQFTRTSVTTQLIPHLEQVGFSTVAAATAMSLLAFFGMSSKIIFGRLSETITAVYSYVVIIAIQIVGLAVLVLAGGSGLAWLGLVVLGLGTGAVGALGPLVIIETFGLRSFGSILGLTRFAVMVPVIFGPLIAGLVFDSRQSYDLVFLITIGFLSVSLLCFILAAPSRSGAPTSDVSDEEVMGTTDERGSTPIEGSKVHKRGG